MRGRNCETGRVSEETTLPRPAQVTASAVMIMVGSVIVVLLAYTGISELRSMQTRETVESMIKDWPLGSASMGVDQMLRVMHVSSIVAGCCAAAAGILGFFVMRRDRSARVGLTVLAVPLFISGLVTGGFAAALVVLASLMLWAQPSRDWFNGVRMPEPSPAERAGMRRAGGFGPPPDTGPVTWPITNDPAALPQVELAQRPRSVVWAAVLTWVGSSVVGLVSALAVMVLAASPDQVMADVMAQQPELADAGLDQDTLVTGVIVLGVLALIWCLVAVVLGVFAFRGAPLARLGLLASATMASVLMFTSAAAGAIYLAPLVMAGVATVVLLMRPDARQWYRLRRDQKAPLL